MSNSRRQVRVVLAELTKFTGKKIVALTLAVTANLVEDNPLDTGWSRNNWVPNIGAAFEGLSGTRDAVTNSRQASGLSAVVSGYHLEKGAVFISNNVPYIGALNDGHSKQAPAGFVQIAILKGVREVA